MSETLIEIFINLCTEIVGGVAAGVGYFLTCNYYRVYVKRNKKC